MAVFRVEKNKNYTIMSNYHLRDRNLSLKARGLLSMILSLPEDWDYTLPGLVMMTRDGLAAVRAALHELEDNGYLVRQRERNAQGKLGGMIYTIYEYPQINDDPASEKPTYENRTLDNRTYDNPTYDNQIQQNTDIQSIDKRRLKNIKSINSCGVVELDEIRRSIVSYQGHLKHGYTLRLRRSAYSKFVLIRAYKEPDNSFVAQTE